MKEVALALARAVNDPAQRLNLLREYLQACALRSLHESEAFQQLVFLGGTALRFLYELPRFSEDLDFSLANASGYQPRRWLEKMKRDLSLAGFNVSVNWNERKTVHVAWIRVAAILKSVGLAEMAGQKLSIKLEIDTRPPAGGVAQTMPVNRHFLFVLRHYDRASLMAGKVHALATRRYAKGRDWFDLLWYRALRPAVEPNLALLQNAFDQTRGTNAVIADNWKQLLRARLETISANALQEDVAPFLERPQDARLITIEHLRSVL